VFGLSKRVVLVIGVLLVVLVIYIFDNGKKSSTQSSSGDCQVQVDADSLNVRSSAAATAPVVEKLTNGTTLAATKTVQGGFREIDATHWASSQFLKVVSGACS
jgi:Tfp pilus assembly protein PilV